MALRSTSYNHGIPVPFLLSDYPMHLCGIKLPEGTEKDLKREWSEIGGEGFWSLSSAKEGNGVYELRDNNPNTFWQSDGSGPHVISIQFKRLMRISRIDLLLNYKADESYTPSKVEVRIGYTDCATYTVKVAEYKKPTANSEGRGDAWWPIRLNPMEALQLNCGADLPLPNSEDQKELEKMLKENDYLEGFCVQLLITENHIGGRDSHVRQIRIYGPVLNNSQDEEDFRLPKLRAEDRAEDHHYFRGMIL